LRRIALMPGSADFMPKNGKTPLTPPEITALTWWVSVGAPRKGTLEELHAPPTVRSSVAAALGIKTPPAEQVTAEPPAKPSDTTKG